MPYIDASSTPSRPHLDVFRISWTGDADELARALEPLRARLLELQDGAPDPHIAPDRMNLAGSTNTTGPTACTGSSDAASPSEATGQSHAFDATDLRRQVDTTERRRAAEALEGLTREGEQVLAEIEGLEASKARLEAELLSAYAALHTIEEQQVAALPAGSPSRMTGRVSTARVVAEEIALATGVGVGEVARRLTLATSPRRHRTILAALRAGTTSLHRALQVASDTAALSDADVALVEEAVLAPSRDGLPVPQRTFVTRLRRAVASVDCRGSAERRAHARTRRGVFGRLTGDGMGCLTLVADADAVAAAMDRLDRNARNLRGEGDPRTLDQLRCDLATEALLRSHLGTAEPDPTALGPADGEPNGSSAHTRGARHSDAGSTPDTGPTGTGRSCSAASDTVAPMTGRAGGHANGRPAALVWLVVPFEVATGASDAACELPGHGWVTGAHAREMMTRPGSAWRTLPVDIDTGQALFRPSKGYRPTRAMVEHVQAVDGVCRGPGCEVLASRCDLDHETPWPTGETAVGNLFSKHRLHHNLKTGGIWTSRPVADSSDHLAGGLEWTTLTGRTYVTRPKDWREAFGPPPEGDDPGRTTPRSRSRSGPEPDDPPPF